MKFFDQIRNFIQNIGTQKQPKPTLSETPRQAVPRAGSNIRVTIQTIEIPLDNKVNPAPVRPAAEQKLNETSLQELRTVLKDFRDGDIRDLLQ